MSSNTVHGHFDRRLLEESERLRKLFKEKLDIDINKREATAIISKRSEEITWPEKKLKQELARLRGIEIWITLVS